jgi:hypothetical protein
MNEIQLLRDPEIFPSKEVLKDILGNVYDVLEALEDRVTQGDIGLALDWHYYKDGKSWLGKVCHKKKTVCWLSVWEGCFKTTFFFLERHLEGIAALDISEQIKEEFCRTKSVGKLLPMLININSHEQLTDLLKVIEFKKKAK